MATVIGLLAAGGFALGTYAAGVGAALLFQLAAIIDCSDGEVARLTFTESPFGAWLDLALDNVVHMAIFSGIAVGAFQQTAPGEDAWIPLALGAAAISGNACSFLLVNKAQSVKAASEWKTPLHEQVNALWLVVAAACLYVLAYRFYGKWIAAKVIELNNQRITPAVRLNDGVNFHPTNSVVLFGHHFAAIAGAGPLLGPVLAAQFGFLPGFLWLVIGAVLAGAVQDFVILVASMRRNGRSLPEIARDELGVVTGTATALAVLFIVVVALAGLGFAVVNALYRNAWGTFTIGMTIPIGFVMGFYLQKFRPGAVAEVSMLGVALLIVAVLLGRVVAQSPFAVWFEYERLTLVWLLGGYGFLASILPGWMLLVPRGYLSTFMKLGVVFLLGFGVIALAPTVQMPRMTTFVDGGGPIISGTVFPFLFITIACGAVSGFHALVSSGTTPKMIEQESQALVGYAAMRLFARAEISSTIEDLFWSTLPSLLPMPVKARRRSFRRSTLTKPPI